MNNSDIKISKIKLKDVEAVFKIAEACNLSFWSLEGIRSEIKRKEFRGIIVKQKEEVRGFLIARLVSNTEIDVLNFGVLEKYRRQGIGSLLWHRLLNEASKNSIESIWLEVRESNLNAIEFYRNKGFTSVQTRKNFYTSPIENALLMKLTISEHHTLAISSKLDSTMDLTIKSGL